MKGLPDFLLGYDRLDINIFTLLHRQHANWPEVEIDSKSV